MGRGRAKAKQTKVARQLKYGSGPTTDLSRLQAELAGGSHEHAVEEVMPTDDLDELEDGEDPYAKYYEQDEDEDERNQVSR